jgi:hypothetical protein
MAMWERPDELDILIDDALDILGGMFGPDVAGLARSKATYEDIVALCEAYDCECEGDVWHCVAEVLHDLSRELRGRHLAALVRQQSA